jgi:hypothetical protein
VNPRRANLTEPRTDWAGAAGSEEESSSPNPDLEFALVHRQHHRADAFGVDGALGAIMLFALQETSRSIARAAKQLAEIPTPR